MTIRRLRWHDVEYQVYDEDYERTLTWFGLFKVVRKADVKHTMPETKDKAVGFK